MLSSGKRFSTALALALALFGAAATVSAQDTPRPDDGVSEKAFRGKVFEVKHRDPDALVSVLRPLGSGFKGAAMAHNREMRTISVRDFPENIAVIEEAIRRLDTPEPARPDVEFRVHILIATNNPQRPVGTADFPSELGDVIKQLQSTLSYKNYFLMTSQVLRGKEGPGTLANKGVAELKLLPDTAGNQHPIFYQYQVERFSLETSAPGPWKAQLGRFLFNMRIPVMTGATSVQYDDVGFNTPVSLREGEKVVVGTTSMQDKGVIIVLVANVIK